MNKGAGKMFIDEDSLMLRQVKIKCIENECGGVITHVSVLTDPSPRVHSKCSKCGKFISDKISNIATDRIIGCREIH